MWDLIVSVPDHCLSFYFTILICSDEKETSQQIMTKLTDLDSS